MVTKDNRMKELILKKRRFNSSFFNVISEKYMVNVTDEAQIYEFPEAKIINETALPTPLKLKKFLDKTHDIVLKKLGGLNGN